MKSGAGRSPEDLSPAVPVGAGAGTGAGGVGERSFDDSDSESADGGPWEGQGPAADSAGAAPPQL